MQSIDIASQDSIDPQNDVHDALLSDAIASLRRANAHLDADVLRADAARVLLAAYAEVEKLAAYGKAVLARRIDDAATVARAAGTSMGKAKATVETGKALADADAARDALREGTISLDQAAEIARAEQASPGSSSELLGVASSESFHVLREKARKVVLEAEQHRGLAERQRAARRAHSHTDELGMVHIDVLLEPHVGTPIVRRAEAEADRIYRKCKKGGTPEPFERYLADAYAKLLSGTGPSARPPRPELVVLVSHEVAKRGWKELRDGDVCKMPGVGPVSPQTARQIAGDAFITGLVCDGKDLSHVRRWTRNVPVEVRLALELGKPPDFDGMKCVDCGARFRNEKDHVEPHSALGPASVDNLEPRCWTCHVAKTKRDREAGRLKRQERKREAERHRKKRKSGTPTSSCRKAWYGAQPR